MSSRPDPPEPASSSEAGGVPQCQCHSHGAAGSDALSECHGRRCGRGGDRDRDLAISNWDDAASIMMIAIIMAVVLVLTMPGGRHAGIRVQPGRHRDGEPGLSKRDGPPGTAGSTGRSESSLISARLARGARAARTRAGPAESPSGSAQRLAPRQPDAAVCESKNQQIYHSPGPPRGPGDRARLH